MQTRKKVKVVGTQTYVNSQSGELIEMEVISIEERDANFHKIWLYHIADALDLISNQKLKVLWHILENLNSENIYIGSQREIAAQIKCSVQTVSITIGMLQSSNFLTIKQPGVYHINPDMIFKGSKEKRLNILLSYNDSKDTKKKRVTEKASKPTGKQPIQLSLDTIQNSL